MFQQAQILLQPYFLHIKSKVKVLRKLNWRTTLLFGKKVQGFSSGHMSHKAVKPGSTFQMYLLQICLTYISAVGVF